MSASALAPELAIAIAIGLIVILVAQFAFIRPFARVQQVLSRLAARDFRPVLLPRPPFFFRQCNRDVQAIAEMLQKMDRQMTDEGFSLRAILASMVEGVLIADRAQRIRLFNDALVNLFNFTTPPMNRSVIEVFRNHALQTALDTALESGEPQRLDLTVETAGANGPEVRHFDVHVASLTPKAHARPMAALLVFHDVTKVRTLEAMRREFLANVSHEFRTPLAIINGYVETLLEGALEDRDMAVHSLKSMQRSGQRLNLLIDDLLTVSRIEGGGEMLEFRPAGVRDILSRVIEQHESQIQQRNARVLLDCTADTGSIECDARRMEQVFSNLIGNALRYGDHEAVEITVHAERRDEWVRIDVRDNGPGIPYDDQPHIFERFYRVHKDRSRDAGGSGLGLSIVKSVVEAHGGKVAVESKPGHGATFTVQVPAVQTGERMMKARTAAGEPRKFRTQLPHEPGVASTSTES